MQKNEDEYITIKKSAFQQNINYFGYYQHLIVNQTKNLDISSFNNMINANKEVNPQLFHIKSKKNYRKKLHEELNIFMSQFKIYNVITFRKKNMEL